VIAHPEAAEKSGQYQRAAALRLLLPQNEEVDRRRDQKVVQRERLRDEATRPRRAG
jgi:hypothetical protein